MMFLSMDNPNFLEFWVKMVIFNTSREYPRTHAWFKFGDSAQTRDELSSEQAEFPIILR